MDLQKEQTLVAQAQEDHEFFGLLFDAYYPKILNYCARRTGDAAVAQDVAAETFFKAMTRFHTFKWRGVSIQYWFYQIATNEIRMYFRSNKYTAASLDLLFEDGFELADDVDFTQELMDAQDALERQHEYKRAQAVLAALPLKYQEVIALRYAEKKKLSEIALILGKKEGTVKSLLSRGLAKMKITLQEMNSQVGLVMDSERRMQPNSAVGIVASEGRNVLLTPEPNFED